MSRSFGCAPSPELPLSIITILQSSSHTGSVLQLLFCLSCHFIVASLSSDQPFEVFSVALAYTILLTLHHIICKVSQLSSTMGNSSSTSQPELIRLYNHADWQIIQDRKDHQVWQHTHTRQKYLAYPILPQTQTQHSLQIYHFRQLNHLRLVTPHAILQDNQTSLCSSSNPVHLLLEYIPARLADVNPYLSFRDRLRILAVSFAALQTLNYVYGPLFVSEDMIAFNEHGQIKVWVNEVFSCNEPSLAARGFLQENQTGSERRIDQKLLNCVTEVFRTVGNWQLQAYPRDFRAGAAAVKNFTEGEQFVNNYCRSKGIQLTDTVPIWQYLHHHKPINQICPDHHITPSLLSQRTSQLSKLRDSALQVHEEPFQVNKPLSLQQSVVREHLYGAVGKSETGHSLTGHKIRISYGREMKPILQPSFQPVPIRQIALRGDGHPAQTKDIQSGIIDSRASLLKPTRIDLKVEMPVKKIISYQVIDTKVRPHSSLLQTHNQNNLSMRTPNNPLPNNSSSLGPTSLAATSYPTAASQRNTIQDDSAYLLATNKSESLSVKENESRQLVERSLYDQEGDGLRMEREEPETVEEAGRGSNPLARAQSNVSENGSINVLDDIKMWQASMLLKISNKGNSFAQPEVLATSQVEAYKQASQPQEHQGQSNQNRAEGAAKQLQFISQNLKHEVKSQFADSLGCKPSSQAKSISYHHDLYSFGSKNMDNSLSSQGYQHSREELFLKFKKSSNPKRKPSCDFRLEASSQLESPSYETSKYTTFGKIEMNPLSINSNPKTSKRQSPTPARTNIYPPRDYLKDRVPENHQKYLTEGSANYRKPSKTTYNKLEERYNKYVLNKSKRQLEDQKSSLNRANQDTSFQSSKERLYTWVDCVKESRAKAGNKDIKTGRGVASDSLKALLRN